MSDDANVQDEAADNETNSSTFYAYSTEHISAYFVFFSTLLALVIVLSKMLHDRPRLAAILPEAGLIIVVGVIAGSFVNLFVPEPPPLATDDVYNAEDNVAKSLLSFSPKVFFIALLPPIIFNSGYHLRRELFFRHIFPILMFAIFGTLIAALTAAFFLELIVKAGWSYGFEPTIAELLTFGALISSTDPVTTLAVFQAKRVDPHLFYLVFGESVLNDAVCLVLFKSFAKFIVPKNGATKVVLIFGEFLVSFLLDAIGSPILGIACAVAAALLFKWIDMRSNKLLELSLYVMIMYTPFLLAELIHLSGIVTILFTGMAARSFVVPNLSIETADTAEQLFRLAAHIAETAIFLELGLSVFGMTGSFNAVFYCWTIVACAISRGLNVYPLTFLFNNMLRRSLLPTLPDFRNEKAKEALASTDHQYELYRQDDLHRIESDLSSVTPRQHRDLKIEPKKAHILWFAGLRGAVAYACVRSFPNTFGHRNEFIITTMAIVLTTVFLLGSTTGTVLSCLRIDMNVDEDKYMEHWHEQRQQDGLILQFEDMVNHYAVRDSDDEDRPSSPESLHGHVEVTASRHFARMESERVMKRRDSLFDYGGGGGR